MNYNFDQINDRRNSGSLKWDVADNELPMWVADMDFQTAPEVTQAVIQRAQTGVFGYSIIPDQWYTAYQSWWKNRHNISLQKDSLIFTTGVIPAISTTVKRMTNTGDNIVIPTPVYDMFFHSVENHGRHVLECPLQCNDQEYTMDFEDLEKKLSDPLTTLMILCNPHNPVGKVWTKEELQKIGSLCKKHHVVVLSDEIHCDLTLNQAEYVPFAAASAECAQNSITCIAASKAFNLAGFQSAAVYIPNEGIRAVMDRGLNSDEVAEPNCFAIESTVAALTKGGEWLDQLNAYLAKNKQYVTEFLSEKLSELKLTKSDATYLLWVDVSALTKDAQELCDFIRKETGLYITAGGQYRGNGVSYVRINIACPLAVVKDGMERLQKGVHAFKA